jgi:hypothetical protein
MSSDVHERMRKAIAAYTGPVKHCPPGAALGAGDLHAWAKRRGTVAGQRDSDVQAWARSPANVDRNGRALSHKELRKAQRRLAKQHRKRHRIIVTDRALDDDLGVPW